MSDENTLVFLKIPSKIGAWSPNTWKTRSTSSYSLNYKGIPYKTVWVEFPDIEKTLKDLGVAAYTTQPDGKTPLYTLPAIYDPTIKTGLTESFAIARYLDEKYPDKPMLVPKGTEVLQKAHINAMQARLEPIWQFMIPKTAWSLNERSEKYFRRTKEEMESQTMEEMYPKGEKRKEEWKKLEKGFGQADKWYGKEDVLVMGGKEKACFADFAFAGYVIWIRILFGKESEELKDVSRWQDGRWGRMIQALEQYE
ncbi:hypothetical protein K435DRAFT_778273 [Dendrothele bispora CBS 962.96]|uniref:GST N-terminal domain-containing protein n=1 Tax=Dendrothele bispora (strain CBS 962.96) TaxID=1314807 RepID=A0A4S8M488_DENBC|nr:hypothetical protein K435DRAFT_778273 [Dendrothele bispora CBS 962.96]